MVDGNVLPYTHYNILDDAIGSQVLLLKFHCSLASFWLDQLPATGQPLTKH